MNLTMKNILSVVILLSAALVFGNETAIRNWLAQSLKLQRELKFEEALLLHTEDFIQINASGAKSDRAEMEKETKLLRAVFQLPDLFEQKKDDKIDNDVITDFVIYMIELETGEKKKITPEERKAIQQKITGGERKKILDQLARDIPSLRENMRMYIKMIAEQTKIVSVKVNGDQAVLVYESPDFLDAEDKYKLRTTEKLVRINGTWLSKECVEKRVLLKGNKK